jgi:RecJ-like exonuclease
MSDTPETPIHPGDEATPGTPGAGEDVCAHCADTGTMPGGASCALCGGTGKVMRGIGDGSRAFSPRGRQVCTWTWRQREGDNGP